MRAMADWKRIMETLEEIKCYFETVPDESYDQYIEALNQCIMSIADGLYAEEDDRK